MKRTAMRLVVALLVSALGGMALAGSTPPVVADLQLRSADTAHWVLHVRSSGPQAFDVVPQRTATRFAVRLYGAILGSTPPLGASPFGTITVQSERAGNVLVTLQLADKTWRARAAQGASANAVDIRLSR